MDKQEFDEFYRAFYQSIQQIAAATGIPEKFLKAGLNEPQEEEVDMGDCNGV